MGVSKSEAQVTDKQAVRFLQDLYDDLEWTTYDIDPDYGIDQKIEMGVTTALHPPTDGAGSYFSML
jgi:hypothetical protein